MRSIGALLQSWMGKRAVLMVFVLCAFPACISIAVLTPPGQSPDEAAHIARAEGLLRGYVLGTRVRFVDPLSGKSQIVGGVRAAPDIFIEAFSIDTSLPQRSTPVFTGANMAQMRAEKRDQTPFDISIPNTVAYFPAAYVPAAIGIAVGRAINARPFTCLMLARLTSGLAFVALGALALGVAAYGEAVLLTVLLMPMTLFLASTENQDGMLIAMVCLACALLTRGSRVAGLVVMVLVVGAKLPYLLLVGVFLLPLGRPHLWLRFRDILIAVTPVLLWVALVAVFVAGPVPRPPYHPGPLFPGDRSVLIDHTAPAVNLEILLGKPSLLLTLPIHTIALDDQNYLHEMIGELGQLSIVLPTRYYRAWIGALVCALAGLAASARPNGRLVDYGFVWLLLIATVWAVMISFYPLWSNAGLDYIDGPQGRYILLLLPFLLFAIPSWHARWRMPPLLPALPTVVLGVYNLAFLPVTLVSSFYLH